MAKANIQTKPTGASVAAFLKSVSDPEQRKDSIEVARLFAQATRRRPRMWGPAIIGYGLQTLKYASGREVDAPHAAFSPRKGNITLYLHGLRKLDASILSRLGKHTISGGCLHIKRLSDVDKTALRDLISASLEQVTR